MCSLCDSPDGILMPVQNEETGEIKTVALCAGCEELVDAYNRGEDVDLTEVLD